MMPPSVVSDEALRLLDGMVYDPHAKADYDVMSGGLVWPDEFPQFGEPSGKEVWRGFLPRYLIAFRASMTVDEPREEFRAIWEQVARGAPNWPGVRNDRCGRKARARLLAAKRREAVCLAELERELEDSP